MSTLLFSLRSVPEDEAEESRELLTHHSINYYETSAGNWGISMPALWLRNNDELETAQQLLHEYHYQRATTQREIYLQIKKEHKNKKPLPVLIKNTARFFLYLAAIAFIFYVYIRMLFEFGL